MCPIGRLVHIAPYTGAHVLCCELRLQHDSRHFRCNALCTWLHVVVFHGFLILILSRLVVSVGVVTMVDFAVLHALFLFEEMEERDRTWFKCFTAIQRLCRLLLAPSEDLFDRSVLLLYLDQMTQAVTVSLDYSPSHFVVTLYLMSYTGAVSNLLDGSSYSRFGMWLTVCGKRRLGLFWSRFWYFA